MLKKFLLFTILCLLFSCHKNEKVHVAADTPDPNFHLYICFGQSNMEGLGEIEEIDKEVDKRFQILQSLDCPELHYKKDEWRDARPPLTQCGTGLSPADYFGRTMATHLPDSVKIGVITVAVGGCDIRLFDKDQYENFKDAHKQNWFTDKITFYDNNPYQFLVNLAKKGQRDGVIKGILLHQGETNTGDDNWPTYVSKIYNDLLFDLNLQAENVPILVGELVSTDNSCCSSMNPIINKLPEIIANAHVISSEGCTAQDIAHFDSEGYRELGRRYAFKMLQINKN
ncbi:MAG: sialate O-acetylesterase [bacterium]